MPSHELSKVRGVTLHPVEDDALERGLLLGVRGALAVGLADRREPKRRAATEGDWGRLGIVAGNARLDLLRGLERVLVDLLPSLHRDGLVVVRTAGEVGLDRGQAAVPERRRLGHRFG